MVQYGNISGTPQVFNRHIDADESNGTTFGTLSTNTWVYDMGVDGVERGASTASIRLSIYSVSGGNPTTRLGYTVAESVADTSPTFHRVAISGDAVPLTAGQQYHLDCMVVSGELIYEHASGGNILERTGLTGSIPPSSYGSFSVRESGDMPLLAYGEDNVAPDVPTNLSPTGTIIDSDPDFSATFTDANQDRGDELNQYKIQVRRVSDQVVMWDTTRSGSGTSYTTNYGGTALTPGTAYEWRTQVSDYFGASSAWTGWTAFTPASTGVVTLTGDPTGKIDETTPDFDGTWSDNGGFAMEQVQVRILSPGGSTLQTGSQFNIADVADGASFTVTWAQSDLSDLAWGTSYQYQMRGFSNGQWSDWSAGRSFSTNSAPAIPSGLQPNTTAVAQTSLPLLTCFASDSDDTTATGLTVTAEILDSTAAVIATPGMTYDAGQSRWEYQTTGTDIPAFGDYTWRAYSFDGTLYSGAKTSAATATRSAAAAFTYAEGPTVTITSPTVDEVLTSNSLTVTWTISSGTQQGYGITVYDATGAAVIDYDAPTSADQTHTFTDVQAIRNGQNYTVTVNVETTLAATGVSAEVPFSVSYPAPDGLATLTATAVTVSTDLWASAIALTWPQTAYGTDVFSHYTVSRTIATGPHAGTVTLATITSPTQRTFTDYFPPSGVLCAYSVTQSTIEGADIVTSAPVEASASITLGGVVLCAVSDPVNLRTSLRYTGERSFPRAIDTTVYQPSDGADPTTVRSPKRTRQPSFDAKVFGDSAATAAERLAEIEALDIAGGTLCYRDNHGRKLFVTMPDLVITDQLPEWFTARVGLNGERFVEGVS